MLYEPTGRLSFNFKADYNYLDLCGLSVRSGARHQRSVRHHRQRRLPRARPVRPRGAQGRLRVRQRHHAAFGLRLPAGPDRISHGPRRHHATPPTQPGSSATSSQEKIFSQEINLISSDAGKVKWVLGAYYQHDRSDFPTDGGFYIGVPPAVFYLLNGTNCARPTAVFGQVSYDMPAGFELQLGAALLGSQHQQRHRRQPVRHAAHAAAGRRRSPTPPASWR